MNKILIQRNCLGDTRTATRMPSWAEFEEANWSHKVDVINILDAFSKELTNRVKEHDWTKIRAPYSRMFYDDMKNTIENGEDFTNSNWYKLHCEELERHHLNKYCPEDVTLFDVLEMIFDCVAAGMARSGDVYPIEISDEILQKAIKNTTDYLINHVKVIGERSRG